MSSRESHIRPLRRLWLYAFGTLALLFLVAPTLMVVPMSFSPTRLLGFPPDGLSLRWYRAVLETPEWLDALRVSLIVASFTSVAATVLGTAAAYGLNSANMPFARTVRMLLAAPMIVPAILIAIGAFYFLAMIGLNKTIAGLTLIHTMLALPLVVITVATGFQTFDMRQELVARSLGAPPWRAFLTVTLPQMRVSIISAALFAFVTSLDEAVVAIFIGGGEAQTLPRKMFTALRDEIEPTVAAISTLLIVVSVALIALTQWAGQRARNGVRHR